LKPFAKASSPISFTNIEKEAFCYCTGFNGYLTIGNGVKEIGELAFANGFNRFYAKPLLFTISKFSCRM